MQEETSTAGHGASDREALFADAKAAARSHNPVGMLEALHKTGIFDGLARYIAAHWSDFDETEASVFVAHAVDALYARASEGYSVDNVGAYVFKVALNKASDEYHKKIALVSLDDTHELAARVDHSGDSVLRDNLVKKAIGMARSWLPELGQENVQKVMALYFDAVEKGVDDLSTAAIADTLGLTEETVRQSRSRGWRRLARVAKLHGVNLDDVLKEISLQKETKDDE